MSHSDRRGRFLAAYTEEPTIAGASRRAGVHRATVYRWRSDPAFVAAMDAAFARWHAAHLARYMVTYHERQRRRAARNAELRPQRVAHMRWVRSLKGRR
jgi:hypothetical protein